MKTERKRMGETHVRLPFGGMASTDPERVKRPWGGKWTLALLMVGVVLLFVLFPLR